MTIQEYIRTYPICRNCEKKGIEIRLRPSKYGHYRCKNCNSLYEKLPNDTVGKELS